MIDIGEYHRLKDTRPDKSRDTIVKERCCFLWKNQYFELDTFSAPERHRGGQILEIELTEENDKIVIPRWIGKVTEVTGNKNYGNYTLARRDCPITIAS